MEKIRGAVIVPGDESEELYQVGLPEVIIHGPEGWAKCMGWDLLRGRQLGKFDINQYDVVLVNGNFEMFGFIAEIKTSFSGKVILLYEGSTSSLSYTKDHERIKYIQTLQIVDAIGSLNWHFEWFRLFTDKPIFWLGVPFPLEEVKKYMVPLKKREHKWALGSNIKSHNTIASLYVAKKANVKKVVIQEFIGDNLTDFCGQMGISFLEKHVPLPWHEFLARYRSYWGGILLSNQYTWGRYALDFATMGLPVVGSVRQFTQKLLFPSLSFEPYTEVGRAVDAVKRLETDLDFYRTVTRYAKHLLPMFSEESARRRMECLLQEIM